MQAVGGFLLILIGIGAIVIIIAPQLIGAIEILINREGLSDQVENWKFRTKAVVFGGGLLLFFLGLGAILQVSVETLSTWFVTPTANPVVQIPVENSPTVFDNKSKNTLKKEPWAAIELNPNERIDVQSWTADRMSWSK